MAKRALSVKEVSQLKKLGTHRVDRNLYLQIKENGARSWLFRWKEDGRMRNKGLGAYRDVPLQEARDTADELRLQLRRGVDLFAERDEARRAKRIEASKNIPSFKWCAEQYIEAHEAEWRNEKHRAQWRSTLKNYVDPVFGSKPVSDVTRNDVLAVLEPIWRTKTETANRLRGRIQIVLDWAKAAGYREGSSSLRLIEARALLVGHNQSVSQTAFAVGYDSPTHFSRDYSRKFGCAPSQHMVRTP